jgi:hypothetical protein
VNKGVTVKRGSQGVYQGKTYKTEDKGKDKDFRQREGRAPCFSSVQ